jgi:NADH:ubiquinone oxidoreductase subunit 3 (subunit A)
MFFTEYASVFGLFLVAIILSCIIFGLSFVVANQVADVEKASAYECGFNPFDDARTQFDIRFYLVAILFIIFDLEISFLFPWVLVLHEVQFFGFFSMVFFLFILTIGFIYEWQKGALEWE